MFQQNQQGLKNLLGNEGTKQRGKLSISSVFLESFLSEWTKEVATNKKGQKQQCHMTQGCSFCVSATRFFQQSRHKGHYDTQQYTHSTSLQSCDSNTGLMDLGI